MPPSAFALLAAFVWGSSDFLAGRSTRTVGALRVVFWTAVAATTLGLVFAPMRPAPAELAPALAWGAVGGLGAGLGALALFHGMAHGRTALVAPVSALIAAGGPVLVGVILGERPSSLAWLGIGLALPSIWLLAGGGTGGNWSGVKYGLAAGSGFAIFFICFGNAPDDSGLWPLVAARAISVAGVGLFLWARRSVIAVGRRERLPLATIGVADAAASGFYLFATAEGLVSLSAVLASLYPVPTVLLAVLFNREKLAPRHWVGVALAVSGACLISL